MNPTTNYAGSLDDLAQVYSQAAQLQTERIEQARAQYNRLPDKSSSPEGYRLHNRLQELYAQRRELLATSAYLRNYYRFSGVSLS